jgi:5-methylthioadenosine/S-adenosylhomocysteine deaminase
VAEDCALPPSGAFFHNTSGLLGFARRELSAAEYAAVLEWDCLSMLLGGTTTIVNEQVGYHDMWADIVGRLGFRCEMGVSYPTGRGSVGSRHDLDAANAGFEGLQANLDAHAAYSGAFDGRLTVHLSPHGPDTVTEEVLRETRTMANALGINIHLHVAQHPAEVATVAAITGGMTSIEYLDAIGFLGPDVLAVHATHATDADLDVLARTGTNLAVCPARRAREGVSAPAFRFASRGLNVSLGTDSFSHDLLGDLSLCAVLGKLTASDLDQLVAPQVLSFATSAPARTLHRSDLGHLNPGARGDVVVVDLRTPFNAPAFDPIRSLVYYSSVGDVRHTLVNGEYVVRDRTIVHCDVQQLREQVTACCGRVWESAKEEGVLPAGVTPVL